ncbi:MAG: hypothetical protein IT567_07280 [Alphaproteobacteria bacterium]|nr:hypothetical protein [Alphaproteobacteria bacterium]
MRLHIARGTISDATAKDLAAGFVDKMVAAELFAPLVAGSKNFPDRDAPFSRDEAVELLVGLIVNNVARRPDVFKKWLGSTEEERLNEPLREFLDAVKAVDKSVQVDERVR